MAVYNPALRQEPRYEPAAVIPLKQEDSMLTWLQAANRLILRETKEASLPEEEDPDLEGLMSIENNEDDDFSSNEPEDLDG